MKKVEFLFRPTFLIMLILMVSCKDSFQSKIEIKNIFNPDSIPPQFILVNAQTDIERLDHYNLRYQLNDNSGGSGIGRAKLYYSPDPGSVEFTELSNLSAGERELTFCAPNSTHTNPTFRFTASDKNRNRMEDVEIELNTYFASWDDLDINSLLPALSLENTASINQNNVGMAIDACRRMNCSSSAMMLGELQNQMFVNIKLNDATTPLAADAGWVSCDDVLTNGLTSPNFLAEGVQTLRLWVKSVDTDFTDVSTTYSQAQVTYDTTAPALIDRVVEGPTLISKTLARYRLTNCDDVAFVFVNKGGVPDASDDGWQACSNEFYTIAFDDYVPGINTMSYWIKDSAENVNTTPLTYNTTYNPPIFTVVDGPTITTPIADISISFCNEASITQVLFNDDGVRPADADSSWQSCSTALGHLKSYELSPGPHTLKAFLKYSDGLITKNPLNVNVNYSPMLVWKDAPSINRPQTDFGLISCEGVAEVYLNRDGDPTPGALDPGWEACSTSASFRYNTLNPGANIIQAWLKDADGNIYPDSVSTTAQFNPPTSSVVDGPDISNLDFKAFLTISECQGISQVYVGLNDTTQPASGDANWVACSTAFGAIESATLVDGPHSLYTWFKYNDGYILDFPHQNDITFTSPDLIPPPIGSLTLTLENGDSSTPPILDLNSSRAFFTLNTCTPTADEEDDVAGVYFTINSAAIPVATAGGWLSCSTAASALSTVTLVDTINSASPPHSVKAYFKDLAGNVTTTFIEQLVHVQINDGTTPPPRPPIEVENAPILASAPAKMRIADGFTCAGIDQIYYELDEGVETVPNADIFGWQSCSDATYDMIYEMILAGEYNLRAWFKAPNGVINTNPRRVSFIFDPQPSSLPTPLAMWTLDQEHIYKLKAVDVQNQNHLVLSSFDDVSVLTGKVKQSIEFDGTSGHLIGRDLNQLKPTVGVTLSLWAYLTNSDAGTKGLAGNLTNDGGYGLEINGGNLRFVVNGQIVSTPTSTLTTGWHHIIGTSNGRIHELYIDGSRVDNFDNGVAANIDYGCGTLFAVGAKIGCGLNVAAGTFFDDKIDEVVVWGQKLSAAQAFSHYVDTANGFKVNQVTAASTSVAAASFYKEITDSALFTVPTCDGIQFIYSDVTTHPPLLTSSRWQPCANFVGAYHREDLPIGPHELKIWTKDAYGNLSGSYFFLDTLVEVDTTAPNPILMYNFDNSHVSGTKVFDLFSLTHATNYGATTGQTAINDEGFRFVRTSSTYVEAKDASYSQTKEELSLSIWAFLSKNDVNTQTIVGNRTGSGHGYSFEIENTGQLSFIVESTSGQRKISIPTSSYETGFHNLLGIYDGTNMKLYRNGLEVATQTFAPSADIAYTCLSSFIVGAGATCNNGARPGTYFNNILDEVAVWNKALSPVQVLRFFSGQDNIPPEPVAVTPKDMEYTIGIPIGKLNVSDCSDSPFVYVGLDGVQPPSDASNWQACYETGDRIETPLLVLGDNLLRVWFRDLAGNVSESATELTMNFDFDFTIPEPGSYWPFNLANKDGATVFDIINDHHGTTTDVAEIAGVSYEGLDFNGVSSRVSVPHQLAHKPTDNLSLSAWIKIDSFVAGAKMIAGNSFGNGGYGLFIENNEIIWRVFVDGSHREIRTNVATWNLADAHHLMGVYGAGILRLFIDNVESASLDLGDTFLTIGYEFDNAFKIGVQPNDTTGNNPGTFFDGMIDEVSFWPLALSDTVADAIYQRGVEGDQVWYNIDPPEVPISLNVDYYNALVSRANLTVNDCTGINFIIVTDSTFPPDKNDEDWQLCNTLVGGTLSKELSTSEEFGKVWTKDLSGNVSKNFQFVPLVTKYDLPIARPIVHWTFDNAHYTAGTRTFLDRISGTTLLSSQGRWQYEPPLSDGCGVVVNSHRMVYRADEAGASTGSTAVLLQGTTMNSYGFLRADETSKLRPTDQMSVSIWARISGGLNPTTDKYLVGNMGSNDRGYAIRIRRVSASEARIEFVVNLESGEQLVPYFETYEITGNNWHLITGVFDGQTASLYIDGIFVKSFSAAATTRIAHNENHKFMIGARPTSTHLPAGFSQCVASPFSGSYTEGALDEVLIWDKPLSKLMISSLYHNGADIIYVDDVTPPANAAVSQENQRPTMFTDKVYMSVASCNDISGVLVNEGTQPDKQDERWEICRTRLGSFSYLDLTPGGHTITLWFKDRAGNVTSTSSDVVIDYVSLPLARANAYWPLNQNHYIDRKHRDIVSLEKENDLLAINFANNINPTATPFPVAQVAGSEGVDLSGNAYFSAATNRLLRPVNNVSAGGWFYLTQSDASTKYLIDKYNVGANENGFRLYQSGGNLHFQVGLYIVNSRTVSTSLAGISTGWNHVVGVFDGRIVSLYLNGVKVNETTPLLEEDYIRWDSQTMLHIGALSSLSNLPTNYLNAGVNEIGVWGLDLKPSEISEMYNRGLTNTPLDTAPPTPSNVSNAFAYYYDTFGSRARMTVLNCTNTPYIYVGHQFFVAPSSSGADWHDCRTTPGAILSATLPTGTDEVYLWAKNANGDVSSIPAVHEIPAITDDREIKIPWLYYSLNTDHYNSTTQRHNDFMLGMLASPMGTTSLVNFLDKQGVQNNTSSSNYINLSNYRGHDLRDGLTIAFWASLTQGDTGSRGLFSSNATQAGIRNLNIYLEGGRLKFNVVRTRGTSYSLTTWNYEVSSPTSFIRTGANFIAAKYDGKIMELYLNGVLMDRADVPIEQHQSTTTPRRIDWNNLTSFHLGVSHSLTSATVLPANTIIDEVMIFDDLLSESEIWQHYKRLKDFVPNDTDPLAVLPTISLEEVNLNAGTWEADRSDPRYSLSSCDGISSVMIVAGGDGLTPPLFDDHGWQACSTDPGAITGPTLANGAQTLYFWFRDRHGNISSSNVQVDIDYTAQPLPNPIAYWPFDKGTIFNSRAYEFMGDKHADIFWATSVAAAKDEGLDFNRSKQFVRVPHSPDLKTEELTVSGWFHIRNPRVNSVLLSNSIDSTDGWTLGTYSTVVNALSPSLENTYLEFKVATAVGERISRIPTIKYFSFATPNHLAVTYDGMRTIWYVNGVKVYTQNYLSNQRAQYTQQTPLFMGAAPNSIAPSTLLFDGIIDEVALFDRALTAEHVQAVFEKTNTDGIHLYDQARPVLDNPVDIAARASIYQESSSFFIGNRIRVTFNDCTNADMILVTDSLTTPDTDDEDWQTCNEFAGGILSAPLATGGATPNVYIKLLNGLVSTGSAALNSINVNSTITIPRSNVHFSMNSAVEGYKNGNYAYETHGYIPQGPFGEIPIVGAPTETDAIHEKGFDFNRATSDYLTYPALPANSPDVNMTLSAWVELKQGDTTNQTIVSNRQNGINEGGAGAGLRLQNGQLQFFVNYRTTDTAAGVTFEDSIGYDTEIYLDGLHHVVGTFTGTRLHLFLDGVLVASKRFQIYTGGRYYLRHDTVSPWMIGAEVSNLAQPRVASHFNGIIDDIRIWNTDLDVEQVYALYKYGTQYLPENDSDGTAPERNDITIAGTGGTLTVPFANIQVPECLSQNLGANSQNIPINAVFVVVTSTNTEPSAPDVSDTGWQYCTLDSDQIISGVLNEGNNYVWVFLRDQEGDVGLAVPSPATPLEVSYVIPEMIAPSAYFKFANTGTTQVDSLFGIALRAENTVSSVTATGAITNNSWLNCTGCGWGTTPPRGFVNKSTLRDFDLKKNFAISFWHQPLLITAPKNLVILGGQFVIQRTAEDDIKFSANTPFASPMRTAQSPLNIGALNHILLTRVDNTLSFYLNGKLDSTVTVSNNNLGNPSSWFNFAEADGYYDELMIFNQGLTNEQALYLYYLGKNNLELPDLPLKTVPATIPEHYIAFDAANVNGGGFLESILGNHEMTVLNGVVTGAADSRVGESVSITRRLDTLGGTTNNITGPPEYLESNQSVQLGSEFTISTWVKLTKATTNNNEWYTILSQWTNDASHEAKSFYLRMRRSEGSTVHRFQFVARINGWDYGVNTDTEQFPHDNLWRHITVKRESNMLMMYIDGVLRGYTAVNTAQPVQFNIDTPPLRIGAAHLENISGGAQLYRFQGLLDELGIWENKALPYPQMRELYARASNADALQRRAIPYLPEVVLASSTNTTENINGPLSLSDCGGHSHVRVIVGGDTTAWVPCSTGPGAILTPNLTLGSNTVIVEFGDGATSSYSYELDVIFDDVITAPPASPVVALLSATTTSTNKADFSVASCNDVTAYYVGDTSQTPSPNASGWMTCSSTFSYKKLVSGVNNISVWFKDQFNQLSTGANDFVITFNPPAIASPEFYLSFERYTAGSAMVQDVVTGDELLSSGSSNRFVQDDLTSGSYRFAEANYLESAGTTPTLGANFTFASWINAATPDERISLFNEWDTTASGDRYNIEIDTTGRLCFAYQTTNSTGAADFNSDRYRRRCTTQKISFSTWQHVAVVKEGAALRFYIDGELSQSNTIDSAGLVAYNASIPLRVGAQMRGGNFPLTGSLDELAVWSTSLTQDQLLTIYGLGQEGKTLDFHPYLSQAVPVPTHYWSFETLIDPATADPFYFEDQVSTLDLNENLVTPESTTGIINNYAKFDGDGTLTAQSNLTSVTDDFTLSTLIYYEAGSGSETGIIHNWGAVANDQSFKIEILADHKVRVTFGSTDGIDGFTSTLTSNLALVQDTWSHIVVTRQANVLHLMINGLHEAISFTQDANLLKINSTPMTIGSKSGSEYLFGKLDETAIWNKYLSIDQLKSLHSRAFKGSPETLPTVPEVSLYSRTAAITTGTADITVGDCLTYTDVIFVVSGSPAPASGDPEWQACSASVLGDHQITGVAVGVTDYDVYFKTGAVVESGAVTSIQVERQ